MKEERITLTLQEFTDKLQTLCHNGHAQKTVLLVMLKDGKTCVAIPYKDDNKFIVSEKNVFINFGEF